MSDTAEFTRGASPQHLADIVASAGDAIVGQTPERIITCWNQAAERLLGWRAETIVGRSAWLLVPPSRRNAEHAILAGICNGGCAAQARTERLRHDGTTIPVLATFSPILRADGGLTGVSTILRDLSAAAPETAAEPVAGSTVPDEAEAPATVLLVEDDVELLGLLRETLIREGHHVIAASDGRIALGLLDMHPEVAAIVSDIVMPNGVSGVILGLEARRLRPDLPVLLMSGHPAEQLGRLGQTLEFPLLVKPFRPTELTRLVRHMLAGRIGTANAEA